MKITKTYETVHIGKLVPYARNARDHDAKQVAQIRASFREFGTLNPCLVDGDYTLIAGHGRLLAAQEEGLAELPCVVVRGLTEAQKKAYRLADNKIAENSTWESGMLGVEIADLRGLGVDPAVMGFDAAELADLFPPEHEEGQYGEEFTLEDGDKKPFQQISLTLHDRQAELLLAAIAHVYACDEVHETFENENKNGNGIYEVVRQWAEQKNLLSE
jgi:hypothetical protein